MQEQNKVFHALFFLSILGLLMFEIRETGLQLSHLLLSFLLWIGIILTILRIVGNLPLFNERLINPAKGLLGVLE